MKLAGSQRVLAPSFPQNIPTENAIRFESFAQLLQTLGSLVPDLFMQDIIFKLITHLYDSFFVHMLNRNTLVVHVPKAS